MRLTWIIIVLALLTESASAKDPRRIGPFRLGMTEAQVRQAGSIADMARPRMELPQGVDVMGLGIMTVRPIVMESLYGDRNALSKARLYLVSGRVAYISLEYENENVSRRDRWFEMYYAPETIQNDLVDITWSRGGVIMHTDRYGTSLHAVDWAGLKASDRALVSEQGAIRVANRYFRQTIAQQAELSLDFLRSQVANWYARQIPVDGLDDCKPPPSSDYTPGVSTCEMDDGRYSPASEAWATEPWLELGVDGRRMSPNYSYRIESSGYGLTTRIMLVASGDIDCDGKVSTLRVRMRLSRKAGNRCLLNEGTWEAIDPLE